MFKILILCTANICRSPMAEHMMRHALSGYDVDLVSAGVHAVFGSAADPQVVKILTSEGIDGIDAHVSKPMSYITATNFDIIFCMETHHLDELQRLSPQVTGRVFLLGHWSHEEIEDPHGLEESDYLRSLGQIRQAIKDWQRHMTEMGLLRQR